MFSISTSLDKSPLSIRIASERLIMSNLLSRPLLDSILEIKKLFFPINSLNFLTFCPFSEKTEQFFSILLSLLVINGRSTIYSHSLTVKITLVFSLFSYL